MDKDNLHHAYVIEGEREAVRNFVYGFLQSDLGIVFENNPDLFSRDYETLSIEEAREIKEVASRKFFGEKRFFVLSFNVMGLNAMNMLLKTLEEPGLGNHFFLITPNSSRLLPTLLSRVVLIKHQGESTEQESLFVSPQSFIKLSKDKRLDEVKNILTLLDKEKITKGEVIEFIKRIVEAKPSMQTLQTLDYALDPAPSLKMLLEFLAISL